MSDRRFGLKCPELGPGLHDFVLAADLDRAVELLTRVLAGASATSPDAATTFREARAYLNSRPLPDPEGKR